MKNHCMISLLLVIQATLAFGQSNEGVSGKVEDSKSQKPMQSVVVAIQNTN